MRVRIERVGDDRPEEVVIFCRETTPEVDALVRRIRQDPDSGQAPSFFKGDREVYLSLKEILFFETDSDRVFAHTASDAFEVHARLYELETALPGYFVRVSRSAIVSILHVYSIQKGLTGVSQVSFRQTHKEVYGSRMFGNELFRKMKERYLYENA
jgi:DNA-binding LytR/AlgR family response regulator